MKYLKLFENKLLDDIIDKMSSQGKSSLTELEQEYLNSYSDVHARTRVENKINKLNQPSVIDTSDDDIEVIKLWNDLDEENMNNFLLSNEISDDIRKLKWNQVPEDVKELFQVYLYENDLLGTDEEPTIDIAEIWNTLDENEVYNFLSSNELPLNFIEKQWNQLPNQVKSIFTKYAQQNRL